MPVTSGWRLARVTALRGETPRVRTLELAVPDWPGHRAGQHVDIRLTAEDGYQARRAYSIASAPEQPSLALTVERLDDGEVSPYLTQEVRAGDRLELRGPVGGYFVWEAAMGGPLLLLAGGSGIVPLMAMLRHRTASGSRVPARLLHSCRTPEDAIYLHDLEGMAERDGALDVRYTFTRAQPVGWRDDRRRVDAAMVTGVAWPPSVRPWAYVCGPSGFVDTCAAALADRGYPHDRIRTERFGPSGGGA